MHVLRISDFIKSLTIVPVLNVLDCSCQPLFSCFFVETRDNGFFLNHIIVSHKISDVVVEHEMRAENDLAARVFKEGPKFHIYVQ